MGRAAHVRLRYIAHFGGQFEADPSVDTATAGVLVQGILRNADGESVVTHFAPQVVRGVLTPKTQSNEHRNGPEQYHAGCPDCDHPGKTPHEDPAGTN